MSETSTRISIAPWKDNKRFAYSVTYDEGLVEILGFAWRLHRDYGVPGHISAFPGLLGKLEGDMSAGFLQSLWNLRKFAESEHLQFLLSQGWTVGCQFTPGSSDLTTNGGQAAYFQEQRAGLETAIGYPVRILAFADATSALAMQAVAQQAGFTWLLTLYDALNGPDDPSPIIRRSPLYHRGPVPNRLANDPYRLLALARERGAWVVDVIRLVDRYPQDPTRDCTPAELEARFKAVQKIGQREVWLASPEAVADYRSLRLSTHIKVVSVAPHGLEFTLAVSESGRAFSGRALTFVIQLDSSWRAPQVQAGTGAPIKLQRAAEGTAWLLECPVVDGLRVTLTDAEG